MLPCPSSYVFKQGLVISPHPFFFLRIRFKRVGPNAMRGRGIGTARGRATIMRGTFSFRVYNRLYSLTPTRSKWYSLSHTRVFL
jgi:hypothetical protein